MTILHHIPAVATGWIRFVLKTSAEKMKQAQTSPKLVRRGNTLDNEGKKMKKLLLATTALTLSAGVAAADVSLTGDARMGFIYDGDDVNLTSRARVTFTLSGETDTGMAFGGSFRADNAAGAAAGTGGSVFISGAFGRL
ncbi:porin, partial [Roseinatronobacter monicus]|uniref:porin n=1 Tax=Roseinatronobacter monicus TaxID=393481 RepID=UPI003F2B5A03